ncbi:transcription elongation factor GreA [Candidatus Saccharibacteria bacterium]|nr:transcription elongation factor GreA [Candidatus Saccharibacteria bacterium]
MKKSITLTKAGKAALESELEELIKNRPLITEKIATAREFGDLKENEEYSSARNEQKIAETRILEIEEILKNAKILATTGHDKATLGSTVVVEVKGEQFTYSLVSPVEANPLEGKISNESPVGKAIFGRKAGEEYSLPNGGTGKILKIA